MAYVTLLHFITQLSRPSFLSLGGAPFVWQVRFGIFGYVWVLESHFGYVIMMYVGFFKVWMYEYFGVGPQVWEDVDGMYPRFLHWLPKYHLSTPSKRSLEVWRMVIDNLIVADVSYFFYVCGILCLVKCFCV